MVCLCAFVFDMIRCSNVFNFLYVFTFFHSANKHCHLAMHVFGLMTQATTLHELDDIVRSTTVVFSSSCSGQEVEKHFQNLQKILTRAGPPEIDDNRIEEENFVVGNKFSKWCIAFCCVAQNV